MTEDQRHARNAARLLELNPGFRSRVAAIIQDLEGAGRRPRIQDAWRSPADQLAAFRAGRSKLRWGFHNATAPDGTPDALAVDLLDDDDVTDDGQINGSRGVGYVLALARYAGNHRCQTGIAWGLPAGLRSGLATAIADQDLTWNRIGWDSCHIEPVEITVAMAKAGARP